MDNELTFGCILWDIRKIRTRNPIRCNKKTVRSRDPNIFSLISFVSGNLSSKTQEEYLLSFTAQVYQEVNLSSKTSELEQ